jgi:hypothetical protein
MTQERMNELAQCLEEKAEGVETGAYGDEDHGGDNDRWCVDLRSAAKKLRAGVLNDFTGSELEEIGCGSDADESEMDELYTESEEA